ncbi:MAG TPA: adenylosuccinate synthetase [Candidatus Bipolaricaulota bacterium]|nr:adenylosuccinate synthetase [Candidatus Bipolaricaulota bacterium]
MTYKEREAMMPNLRGRFILLSDLTFGDNGKGSVSLRLAQLMKQSHNPRIKWAIRPNGGGNAGHSYRDSFGRLQKSHYLPLAVFDPDITAILAAGMVIDPVALKKEMTDLRAQGVNVSPTLIDGRAQVVLPIYRSVEAAIEILMGNDRIGTTGSGIGPTYAMQAFRVGPTFFELLESGDKAEQRLKLAYDLANAILRGCGRPEEKCEVDNVIDSVRKLGGRVTDTLRVIDEIKRNGDIGLIEPGQGALLDRLFGTYPYVTSSSTTAAGLIAQAGLTIMDIAFTIGVSKLYATRVGGGPFPGEDKSDTGESLRQRGAEFGVTTGRPRRCGPLNLPLLRQGIRLCAPNFLCFTKLDVLDSQPKIPVVDTWQLRGERFAYPPARIADWDLCEPDVVNFNGWKSGTGAARSFSQLPDEAQDFLLGVTNSSTSHFPDAQLGIITCGERLEQMVVTDAFRNFLNR